MPTPLGKGEVTPKSSRQGYVRLYRIVIRQRAGHFCVITYFIGTFFLWFVMVDCLNALWNWLRISTWIMAGASWASATVPMMILRKIQLTAPKIYSPNRYQKIIKVLLSGSFITSSFLCILSSTLIWMTYLSSAAALNNDPQLAFTKTVPGRRASQINERPIYLLASCVYTAFCYAILGTFEGKWHYRPSESSEKLTIPYRIWKSLSPSLRRAQKLTVFCTLTFMPLYLLARRYIIRAIVFSKYAQLTRYIKPHLVMLIKFNSAFTLTSTVRLVMLNMFMVSMWEVLQACWDVYSTQPFDLSQFHADPNRSLLEGIQSSDLRIQYHAFNELAHLSWSNPTRRISIFKDIRTTPRILNLLIEECLKVIEEVKTLVENRGQVPTEISATTRNPLKADANTSKAPQVGYSALKNDLPQLFKNPPPKSKSLKSTLLTKLLSSNESHSLSSQTAVSGVTTGTNLLNDYQIPEVFQSPRRRNSPSQINSESNGSHSAVAISTSPSPSKNALAPDRGKRREKVLPKLWQILKRVDKINNSSRVQQLETWLFSPSVTTELEKCLGNRHIFTLAVESVTNFTCASLTEDQYGVLQGQIPGILKSMVDCCNVLENYRFEICKEFGIEDLPQSEDSSIDVHSQELRTTLDIFLDPMLSRLKDGTNGILEQFKPYIKEWTIDPQIERWILQQRPTAQVS